MIMKTGETL